MKIKKLNFYKKEFGIDGYAITHHDGSRAILTTAGCLAFDCRKGGHGAGDIAAVCKHVFGKYIDPYGFALSSDTDVFKKGDEVILDGNWFDAKIVKEKLPKLIKIINGE